jgi:HK97 family phage prohead protease
MDEFLNKSFGADATMVDEKSQTLDHCISDGAPDRVGDDINQDGWETKNYMLNPVVLDNHNYHEPPIGKCLKVYRKGDQMRAVTQFAPTVKGQQYFELFKDGYMNAFSVGFIPKEYDINKTGGFHIDKQELLEYSVVTVPCNPRALKSFLQENKSIGEDKDMNKSEVDALVKESVSKSIGELTAKHVTEIGAKDATIAENVKTIAELNTKILDMDVQIKSGAKLSKANANCLCEVAKGLTGHAATLTKFAADNSGATSGSDTGKNDGNDAGDDASEKEYSDSEIQELVASNITKIIAESKEEK